MNPPFTRAFLLSAALHGGTVAVLLFFAYVLGGRVPKDVPRVLVLVQGAGDNYGATVAPALGVAGGIKIPIATPPPPAPVPEAPAPKPEPVAVETAPPPTPVTPAPATPPVTPATTTAAKSDKPAPSLSQSVRKQIVVANSQALRDLRKKHAAEDAEKKRLAQEEAARLKAKTAEKTPATKFKPINAEGIRNGVVVHIVPNGKLSNAHVIHSSGNAEFDQAVVTAFGRVQMPEHPEKKSEDLELVFRTKEIEQR